MKLTQSWLNPYQFNKVKNQPELDQIPNYSVFEKCMNTKYQIIHFLKMNEYPIVLFCLNFLNTEKNCICKVKI